MKLQICSMVCIYTLRRLDFIINLGLAIKLQTRMRQLRANVSKNQTFSKYRGNSQKINSAHILTLGRP